MPELDAHGAQRVILYCLIFHLYKTSWNCRSYLEVVARQEAAAKEERGGSFPW